MDMEMTINQKIEWVKDLLSGQYSLWNRRDFYIPVSEIPTNIAGHFWEILKKFEREGLVRKAYLGYAGLFDAEHKPEVFKKIGDDGKIPAITYEDGKGKKVKKKLQPTYYIEIDATKLSGGKQYFTKEDVKFEPLNGTISFGKISHSFQENNKEKLRVRLFKALWNDRKVIKGGKEKTKGLPLPPGTVAARMELVESKQDFDRNQQLKKKVALLIKNVKTTLRLKKLPITIRKSGGIQIVIEIK
ncbi:MAG: hypothetical protein KJI71_01825 [Patescibacteria group bacterium]|nr:hypothetical protein [Patescibacteria group bacterium]